MAPKIPMTHEGRQALVRLIMDRNHQLWGDARMELPPDPPVPPAPPGPGPTPPPPTPSDPPAPPPPTPPAPGTFVGEDGEIYQFPADTALANMQPAQVAEYWRHKARKHESTVKQRADYDQLKADSAELSRVRQQNETDNEKAVREAREAATATERAAQAPRLVASEFRAAAKGVLTDAQRDALLEDLDLSKYVTANGDVDVEKVGKKVAAFAPSGGAGGTGQFPDLGQGHRDAQSPKGLATGKELFDQRRGKASTNP